MYNINSEEVIVLCHGGETNSKHACQVVPTLCHSLTSKHVQEPRDPTIEQSNRAKCLKNRKRAQLKKMASS